MPSTEILKHISVEDALKYSQTDKLAYKELQNPELWKHYLLRDYKVDYEKRASPKDEYIKYKTFDGYLEIKDVLKALPQYPGQIWVLEDDGNGNIHELKKVTPEELIQANHSLFVPDGHGILESCQRVFAYNVYILDNPYNRQILGLIL